MIKLLVSGVEKYLMVNKECIESSKANYKLIFHYDDKPFIFCKRCIV
jgi:hypothetical protein